LKTKNTQNKRRQFQPTLLAPQPHFYLEIHNEPPIVHMPLTDPASAVNKVPVHAIRKVTPLVIPGQGTSRVIASSTQSPSISVAPGKSKARLRLVSAMISIIVVLSISALYIWLDARDTVDVTLYEVGRQNSVQYIGGGGIVFPRQQLDLSYPVAERVTAVMVKAGDVVAPNQPLIRLDPAQLDVQVKQASDNMSAAQAYLNSVSTNGNTITVAQAQQQYNIARNKYNSLVAQSSSSLLRNGELISPMHGVITSVNIDPGEVFSADTALLTIMDESIAVVHAKIPLVNLDQISLNQQAIVTSSALPDHDLQGFVSAIIPHADPQTDTFELWVSVPNPGRMLLPGMSAFVRLPTPHRAFVVPRLAVLDPDHRPAVFIAQDQHAYIRHVHVVGRVNDSTMIDNGLTTGEKIVLVGLDKLRDGQKVGIRATEDHAF
jgi:RND family efflux transporter MFP subunit